MKFTIERSKWNHGLKKDMGEAKLLNSEGYICFLGFVCLQSGYCEEDIMNKSEPREIEHIPEKSIVIQKDKRGNIENSNLGFSTMLMNDDLKEGKEERLQQLFKEYGHTIEFV